MCIVHSNIVPIKNIYFYIKNYKTKIKNNLDRCSKCNDQIISAESEHNEANTADEANIDIEKQTENVEVERETEENENAFEQEQESAEDEPMQNRMQVASEHDNMTQHEIATNDNEPLNSSNHVSFKKIH